jgi:alpha-beta hydrolase superfamily lysophospholipase
MPAPRIIPLRRRTRAALGLGAAVLVILAGFLWISSSFLLTPNRRGLEPRHREFLAQPSEHGLDLERFEVTTGDGIRLAALLATRSASPGKAEKLRRMADRLGLPVEGPPPAPRGTVFLLHGRSGVKEDLLAVAERFAAARYRCVVYDARCHGESGGENCTFGHFETADFREVMDQSLARIGARGEDPGQVCAFGVSLGASVLLQSLPAEPRLDAVVAVAPFASLPEVINHAAKRSIHRQIPLWLIAGTMMTGGARAGFDPYRIAPIRDVASTRTPLFFTHGALDEVIPVDHTRRLHAAAAGPKELRIVPEGTHGNVLAKGGDDLYEEMIRFFLASGSPR